MDWEDFYLSEIRYKLINYSYEKNKKIIWTKREETLIVLNQN